MDAIYHNIKGTPRVSVLRYLHQSGLRLDGITKYGLSAEDLLSSGSMAWNRADYDSAKSVARWLVEEQGVQLREDKDVQ